MEKRVFFFDLLRCMAAIAVIAIHVLAPYRHELGTIPMNEWFVAITVNGFSRWAVPVFIMITGALMLNDTRPFNAKYYVSRRLGKVLIPFIIWSLFYAYLSGWSEGGYDSGVAFDTLKNVLHKETYYHLGFFYYFIPLYFVIPFFQILVQKTDDLAIFAFLSIWILTTALFLFRIDGPWSHQLWLYSGYLLLGYVLYKKVPLTKGMVTFFVILGAIGLFSSVWMVATESIAQDKYTFGRWLSYKTLNTVVAASMVFMLCRQFGEGLRQSTRKAVGFISQNSLGIYILHPIFLWPMKEFEWFHGHPMWVIPLWILLSGSGALFVSWILSKSNRTSWLLP